MNGVNAYTKQMAEISDSMLSTGQAEKAGRTSYTERQATQNVREGKAVFFETGVTDKALGGAEKSSLYEETGKTEDLRQTAEGTEEKDEEKDAENTANRLTEEEYQELRAEGITVEELTAEQLERAIERLRLGRAMKQEAIAGQQEKIREKRAAAVQAAKQILANDPRAERIAEHLTDAGVPVTEKTVARMLQAIELSEAVGSMSDGSERFLIRKGLEPTLENVYKAVHSSGANQQPDVIEDGVWESLKEDITKIIERAGFPADDASFSNARWLLSNRLPVTEKNLQQKKVLSEVRQRSQDEVMELAAAAIADGMEAEEADLAAATRSETADRVSMIQSFTGAAVDAALAKKQAELARNPQGNEIPDEALDLRVSELKRAQEELDKNGGALPQSEENFSTLEFSYASVRAKRQLEEIRLKLTVESGYRMERQGIRLNTAKLSEIVDGLKRIEESYYDHYMHGSGLERDTEARTIFRQTLQNMQQLAETPSYTLGQTFEERETISLENLTKAGNTLKAQMIRAGEAYDLMRTMPREDMGDSMEKAFRGVEGMLREMGMPQTEENCRAVRILGYNAMAITEEHIEQVKEYDAKVNSLMENMHPGAVLKMIKEGVNPLTESVEVLNERVNRIREEEGLNEDERFSNYLVQVEKNGSLGEEERKAYIGLYRLFHQIEESDGAAAGSVLRNGQELTLSNLLQAVKTGKRGGVDIKVGDEAGVRGQEGILARQTDEQLFEGLKESAVAADISVKESYNAYKMEGVSEELAKERVEQLRETTEGSKEAQRFLEEFSLPQTMENLMAAKLSLKGDGSLYKDLKELKKKYLEPDGQTERSDAPVSTEEYFSEEGAEALYDGMEQTAEQLHQAMFASDQTSSLDLNTLRRCITGVRFLKETAKRECFDFPMETKEGIRNLHVTLTHAKGEGGTEGGTVSMRIPLEALGTVNVELSVKEGVANCFISSDSREGTELLEHSERELVRALETAGVAAGRCYFARGKWAKESQPVRADGIYKEENVTLSQDNQETEPMKKVGTQKLFQIAKAVFVHITSEETKAERNR